MNDDQSEKPEYIHGSSAEERQRLSLLNDILNDSCLKELNLQPGVRVVDFGSGLGQFTRLMARTVGDAGQVIGFERDPGQLQQARELAESEGEQTLVEFRQGDALAPPLKESEWGSFDVAHARFLLEHVSNPGLVVAQMARTIRPGGKVFIIDDDHGDFRPWPEPAGFDNLWQAYVRSYENLGNEPYVGRHLVSLLHQNGLTAIRNGGVFFGGAGGSERFLAIADNLIAALEGARDSMLSGSLLDQATYRMGMEGLRHWKADPSAALWYSACFAEGVVPG